MKAKTKFKKMFYKLPEKARKELVLYYAIDPMTLNICWIEIQAETELGAEILEDLGYEDDKNVIYPPID